MLRCNPALTERLAVVNTIEIAAQGHHLVLLLDVHLNSNFLMNSILTFRTVMFRCQKCRRESVLPRDLLLTISADHLLHLFEYPLLPSLPLFCLLCRSYSFDLGQSWCKVRPIEVLTTHSQILLRLIMSGSHS